ncbi:DNA mismatch repair protein Msh6 [Chionoecetes opilio]|uniref:DNA mismatch repair protein Msh6 n=1 Tax=Chionoecetes opilio TaxID=41210 RepID=A0A8J4XYD7_CHIOP|nr:DNA mismatch repair protein Msh6 [Chionoecetes opilio]
MARHGGLWVEWIKKSVLDGATLHSLEVFRNASGGTEGGGAPGLLLHALQDEVAGGDEYTRRLLRSWLCAPLCSPAALQQRLDAIADLRDNPGVMAEVVVMLKTLPHLERMLAKVHRQGLNPPVSRQEGFLAALKGFKTCIDIVNLFKDD